MILYRIFIRLYRLAIAIAALFRPKARAWQAGRKGLFSRLEAWRETHADYKVCWMHCASLGEFEQGRSLLEAIHERCPNVKLVLTFFSPSGYEMRKDYSGADFISYLPLDTKIKANRFVRSLRPDLAIFVKYEFWYYHLQSLFQAKVPTILISALFRKNQLFFKPYGKAFLDILDQYAQLFVQEEASLKLLANYGINNVQIAGDTRVDRSADLPNLAFEDECIEAFVAEHPILVVGSSWPPDERIIFDWVIRDEAADWKVLMAPHDIGHSHIERILENAPLPLLRYTEASPNVAQEYQIMLLDTIGMLSKVYRYGKVAYIGGGFGAGIHNTLEAIAYGIPVFFGPKYQKFREAHQLIKTGGGFSIKEMKTFAENMEKLEDPKMYKQAAKAAKAYIQENVGASKIILNYLSEAKYLE